MPQALRIEVLVVPDCPHEAPTRALVETLIAELDPTASVTTTVISTDEQAHSRGFTGSPTVLINGHDPFAEPDAHIGLTCRIYRTPHGAAGVPNPEALAQALRAAIEVT